MAVGKMEMPGDSNKKLRNLKGLYEFHTDVGDRFPSDGWEWKDIGHLKFVKLIVTDYWDKTENGMSIKEGVEGAKGRICAYLECLTSDMLDLLENPTFKQRALLQLFKKSDSAADLYSSPLYINEIEFEDKEVMEWIRNNIFLVVLYDIMRKEGWPDDSGTKFWVRVQSQLNEQIKEHFSDERKVQKSKDGEGARRIYQRNLCDKNSKYREYLEHAYDALQGVNIPTVNNKELS